MPTENLLPIVADQASKAVGSKDVSGTLSDIWQGLVGDRVQAWRINNMISIQQKLQEKLDSGGLKINLDRVSPRYAFTWFEKASEEDEDDIQELFARLLLNAAAGKEEAKDRRYLKLVSDLNPESASLFKEICDFLESRSQDSFFIADFNFGHIKSSKGFSDEDFELMLAWESLISLGLVLPLDEIDVSNTSDGQTFSRRSPFSTIISNSEFVGLMDDLKITHTGVGLGKALGFLGSHTKD